MKLVRPIVIMAILVLGLPANAAPGQWDQPAASLAEEIVGILGPGQARLIIRNLSTVPADEIPAIRKLIEQDLKAHGVVTSGAESANVVRITLSENARERLWVAEVLQGNETRVAMVRLQKSASQPAETKGGLTLRKQTVLATSGKVLAALETGDSLVAIEPEEIVIFSHSANGWQEQKRVGIGQKRPLNRDPRSVIVPTASGDGFEAFVAGMTCSGSYTAPPAGEWTVHCRESDDPWPILVMPANGAPANATQPLKAFYNAARNSFTGVMAPSIGVDLLPFYAAALVPRTDGAGLLMNGIDGKVQLVENGVLKPVAGTRDWGSDFAALNSGCGGELQIIASGSGEAVTDSLRAYDLPGQEAIPASASLAVDGTVTALWTAPDGKSLLAVVRGAADRYEVDRVTASCN